MTQQSQNIKNILVDYENRVLRDQVATLLETIATKLKQAGTLTLKLGQEEHTVQLPESVVLEVKLEEKNGQYSLEFELEWREGAEEGTLTIE